MGRGEAQGELALLPCSEGQRKSPHRTEHRLGTTYLESQSVWDRRCQNLEQEQEGLLHLHGALHEVQGTLCTDTLKQEENCSPTNT